MPVERGSSCGRLQSSAFLCFSTQPHSPWKWLNTKDLSGTWHCSQIWRVMVGATRWPLGGSMKPTKPRGLAVRRSAGVEHVLDDIADVALGDQQRRQLGQGPAHLGFPGQGGTHALALAQVLEDHGDAAELAADIEHFLETDVKIALAGADRQFFFTG